jgi:hypothetical protein
MGLRGLATPRESDSELRVEAGEELRFIPCLRVDASLISNYRVDKPWH